MEDKKWYVVKAISGQENKVKAYIEQEVARLKMQDYVSSVLVPMERVYSVIKGKRVVREKPFFSGYIMIEALLDGELVHAIRLIPGVVGFLSDVPRGEPTPLRKADVNRMLGRVDAQAELIENDVVPFIKGDAVKVVDGPFNGFDGMIEEVSAEKRKVKVEVKIFGRKTPLELSFNQIEKI